jgi:RHS repeat-associated protein
VYDGEDILLEYDGANVLQARYTHGPGIDEPIAMQRGGATYFYHQDGLGTVTDLTDSTATTAQSYAYDAYGNIIQQTGTVENPYTYTGREFDAETGLYYYRARYYDPRIATFLQKDPTGTKGGPNPYAYADNNPLRFTDPSGLTPIPGYKWCGEGDDPTMKDPKNDLDKACEVHDGCYNPLIKKGLKLPGDVFEFPKDPALCAAKDDCDKTLCEAARKFKPNNSYDLVATIYIINLFCNYHQYGEHGGPLY